MPKFLMLPCALLGALLLLPVGSVARGVPLSEGDYWDFQWHDDLTRFAQGSGTTYSDDYGRFRIQLGSSTMLGGVEMFEMMLSGAFGEDAPVDWARIGTDTGGSFYGWNPGDSQLTVLFSPTTALWPGSGLLTGFSASTLVEATPGSLSNPYYSGPADEVEESFDENKCEFFPGIGLICGGDDDINLTRREYWTADLGPVGVDYRLSYEFCGGGFCSGGVTDRDVGLVASSFTGDPIVHELETEPNQVADLVPLPLGKASLVGTVRSSDASDELTIQLPSGPATLDIHDWYRFTVNGAFLVDFRLSWEVASSDLDLVIVDYPITDSPAQSLDDNVASGIRFERIYYALSAGDYLLGVSGFTTPGVVEYTLTHNVAPTSVSVVANPVQIAPGESSVVSWVASNAASCSRPTGGGLAVTVPLEGQMSVSPSTTSTYEINCSGNGSATGEVTVFVVPEPLAASSGAAAIVALICVRRRSQHRTERRRYSKRQ